MALRLVVDNSDVRDYEQALQPVDLAYFDSVIERTRAQLLDDLSHYHRKIADIAQLDPANRTGLLSLYRTHETHIRRLLTMISQ